MKNSTAVGLVLVAALAVGGFVLLSRKEAAPAPAPAPSGSGGLGAVLGQVAGQVFTQVFSDVFK